MPEYNFNLPCEFPSQRTEELLFHTIQRIEAFTREDGQPDILAMRQTFPDLKLADLKPVYQVTVRHVEQDIRDAAFYGLAIKVKETMSDAMNRIYRAKQRRTDYLESI